MRYKTEGSASGEGDNRFYTDAEVREHGYRMGLDTPVVHAVNAECSFMLI